MSADPRIRYFVLTPIGAKDDGVFWQRVGCAFGNPDGTIDAYLDATTALHHVRLRELAPGEHLSVQEGAQPS